MGSPEMLEKYGQGPVGLVTVLPSGPPAMGKALGLWFAFWTMIVLFYSIRTGRKPTTGIIRGLGGNDQLFNLNVGRDIMPGYGLEPQIVLTTPLLEGLDGIEKMSKSKNNGVDPQAMIDRVGLKPTLTPSLRVTS